MSWEVNSLIARKRFGSSTRKVIALCLGNYAGPEGDGIYPSVGRLARSAEVDPRTVQRTIRAFEDEGLLECVGERPCQGGSTKEYRFVLAALERLADAHERPEPPAQDRPGTVPPPAHDPGTPGTVPPEPSGTGSITTEGNARAKPHPIPEDWKPDDKSVQIALAEGIREQEIDDAAAEFCEFWRSESRTKRGRKSEQGWQLAFRNRVKALAKQWGRSPPPSSRSGGERRGGSSLADIAARLHSDPGY